MPVEPLLEIDRLSVVYGGRGRSSNTRAVDDVSFSLTSGETLGLVGGSGSGKTSIGAAVLGLAPATSGHIVFDGEEITNAGGSRRRALSSQIQMIFQDPYHSLNPARTVAQTLVEPLLVHESLGRTEMRQRITTILEKVGLDAGAADRYPGQFSGGQRQRIAIARALIVAPRLVICDEAVSALDLSVQAQVLNLLLSLQEELALSYLFISHDLSVVRHMAQRIVVLFGGRVMEVADTATISSHPRNPYTKALLEASPVPDPVQQMRRRRPVGRDHTV